MAKVKKAKAKSTYKKPMSKKKRNRFIGNPSQFQAEQKEELKFFEVVPTTNPGQSLPDIGGVLYTSLCQVPQGTTGFSRIGKSITVKKIQGRMSLTVPASSAPATFWSDAYKICVVLDTKANLNNATVAYTDVMAGQGIGYMNNLSNSKRFKILKVFEGNMNNGYSLSGDGIIGNCGKVDQSKTIKFNIKCNIPITWNQNNTNGVLSEMTTNNIFIIGISKNGSVLISEDTGNSTYRIRYSDA